MNTAKIFVYGTLKQGFRAHHMLGNETKFLGATKIPGVLVSCGHFPGLLPDNLCEVHGEVYEIPEIKLRELDFYEGVARGLFTRETVPGPFGEMIVYQYASQMARPPSPYVLVAKEGTWRNQTYPSSVTNASCWTYKEERRYWSQIKGESAETVVQIKPPEAAPEENKGAQGVVPPWEGRVQRALERQYNLPALPAPTQADSCSLPEPESGPLVLPKLGSV